MNQRKPHNSSKNHDSKYTAETIYIYMWVMQFNFETFQLCVCLISLGVCENLTTVDIILEGHISDFLMSTVDCLFFTKPLVILSFVTKRVSTYHVQFISTFNLCYITF